MKFKMKEILNYNGRLEDWDLKVQINGRELDDIRYQFNQVNLTEEGKKHYKHILEADVEVSLKYDEVVITVDEKFETQALKAVVEAGKVNDLSKEGKVADQKHFEFITQKTLS